MFSYLRRSLAQFSIKNFYPSELGKQLRDIDWDGIFHKATLDDLDDVKFSLRIIQRSLERAEDKKCSELETLPPVVTELLDKQYGPHSAKHKELIAATVPYVVQIVPRAKKSQRLKLNIRRILGDHRFTANLPWAAQWNRVKGDTARHLSILGRELEFLYKHEELGKKFSSFPDIQPHRLQQPVPEALCGASLCRSADENVLGSAYDLECTYIHFLRMLATILDRHFQNKVKQVLAEHDIKFVHYSGGIKGFERMLIKFTSEHEYGLWPLPRPSYNNDVVRCLVTFETVEDMQRGIPLLATVFDGGYNKFNNGMNWNNDEAKEKHYLRLILATGKFMVPELATFGDCRRDATSSRLWGEYGSKQSVPSFVGRCSWQQYVNQAMQWINQQHNSLPVWMNCEIQMLLRPYTMTRRRMHELYKVYRAPDAISLHNDYVQHQRTEALQNQHTEDGNSPSKLACRDGDMSALKSLLSQDDVEDVDDAFVVACDRAQDQCAVTLVNRVTNSDTLNKGLRHCVSPRSGCSLTLQDPRRERIVQRLLAVPTVTNSASNLEVALVYSCKHGLVGCTNLLLRAKANLSAVNSCEETALYKAAYNGHCTVVDLLLQAKAQVNKTSAGMTPLYLATNKSHTNVVRQLIVAKAELHRPSSDGFTPLMTACDLGNVNSVELLIDAKAELNRCNAVSGKNAILCAELGGNQRVVQLLIEHKADVNLRGSKLGHTAAIAAVHKGHARVLTLLIQAKADVNLAANRGDNPIHHATWEASARAMQVLITAKANLNTKFAGRTPRAWAKKYGHDKVLKLLVDAKAQL